MKLLLGALVTVSVNSVVLAQPIPGESFLGLYMQNQRIGYSRTFETADATAGKGVERMDNLTVMDAALLGTPLKLRIDGSTWVKNSQPIRMKFKVSSAGLNQTVDAQFGTKNVVVQVENVGKKSKLTLTKPVGTIVDDPLTAIIVGKSAPGVRKTVFVFDPMTVAFIKNEVVVGKPQQIKTDNGTVTATVIDIIDPRASTRVFLTGKGDLIKATSGMGIEMRPISRQQALAAIPASNSIDLANATLIKPEGDIPAPRAVRRVELLVKGRSLEGIPNDENQTVEKEGDAWKVTAHPVEIGNAAYPLGAVGQAEFLKPSHLIPSDSKRMKDLAGRLTKGKTTLLAASRAIHDFVQTRMVPNAGMGMLRNAEEVLDRKEGVCRDYAMLTTTLLRSAGIPARLVGGMIFADGAFYYHAWSEAWNGKEWVGIDSTLPEFRISAAHLKLSDGNVDKAFSFPFLEDTRITVLSTQMQ